MIIKDDKHNIQWLRSFEGLENISEKEATDALASLQQLKTILLEIDIEQVSKQKIFNLENKLKQVA